MSQCRLRRLLCYHSKTVSVIIFSTAEPFASTLSLMVDHYKSECLEKVLDCYGQGQGHSKGSKFELIFALRIFSEPKGGW